MLYILNIYLKEWSRIEGIRNFSNVGSHQGRWREHIRACCVLPSCTGEGREELQYNLAGALGAALVLGIFKRFAAYLERPFDLITDHWALLGGLRTFRNLTSIHKKSPELWIADFLSRVRADGSVEGDSSAVVTLAQVAAPEQVLWTDEIFTACFITEAWA